MANATKMNEELEDPKIPIRCLERNKRFDPKKPRPWLGMTRIEQEDYNWRFGKRALQNIAIEKDAARRLGRE